MLFDRLNRLLACVIALRERPNFDVAAETAFEAGVVFGVASREEHLDVAKLAHNILADLRVSGRTGRPAIGVGYTTELRNTINAWSETNA